MEVVMRTYRERQGGRKPYRYRRPLKRRSRPWIIAEVEQYLRDMKVGTVTKEELAGSLAVSVHEVAHALHCANLKGLVSQAFHAVPMDCNRSRGPVNCGSGWGSDTYRVRDPTGDT